MKTWMIFTCLFLFLLTALAACTTPPPPTATPDIPATVTAQLRSHLAAIPTATPAPTYTPYPTPTKSPTATPYPTATPRPTYTLYPTPTPRPTATSVPEVIWETVSDDAGSYTIRIPEHWILDSVEIYEDGKSSLTVWKSSDGDVTSSVKAIYSEYGWIANSEMASKSDFDERVASADTIAVEEPIRGIDGWRYVVETLGGSDTCAFRNSVYWEIRYTWAFILESQACLHFATDTYVTELIEAIRFEPTAYGKR